MSRRFRLQCGTVVTVDDRDAYLLKTKVWRSHRRANGEIDHIRCGNSNACVLLHREILPGHEVVIYKNGDPTDCRRENLQGMTKAEFDSLAGKNMAGGRRVASLAKAVAIAAKPAEVA